MIEFEYKNANFSDAMILATVLNYEFGLTLTEDDVIKFREPEIFEAEDMRLIYKHFVNA